MNGSQVLTPNLPPLSGFPPQEATSLCPNDPRATHQATGDPGAAQSPPNGSKLPTLSPARLYTLPRLFPGKPQRRPLSDLSPHSRPCWPALGFPAACTGCHTPTVWGLWVTLSLWPQWSVLLAPQYLNKMSQGPLSNTQPCPLSPQTWFRPTDFPNRGSQGAPAWPRGPGGS